MKKILTVLVIVVISLSNCKKSNDTLRHINCDGLVTDTLGTGDAGRIFIPNAFTPNGDGNNDIIRPITLNIASLVFTIYDENNVVVFSTAQMNLGWSTQLSGSVATKYYYKIQAVTNANKHIGVCGDVYALNCRPGNIAATSLTFESMLTQTGFDNEAGRENLSVCP